jgi:hypothetical protein
MIPSHYLALFLAVPASVLADGAFFGAPPDARHPWAVHDMNRPQPTCVEPGTFSSQQQPGQPPSDAVVLFGGGAEEISKWCSEKNPDQPTQWIVVDGALQCAPGSGYIRTKEEFSDCQLHVEWTAPTKVEGDGQGRGNSGVFLPGGVEVQVLDNYENPSYADGMAGSVYGVNPPMANPLRKPGEWQTYDIIFRRPLFKDGQMIDPGYLTVFINNVLVQDHTPIEGGGGHKARSHDKPWAEKGPFKIQDHGNPVRFRNIWYRPLPKRVIEGGDGSHLPEAQTQAKREEIASNIRADAAQKQGLDRALRFLESTYYAADATASSESMVTVAAFAKEVSALAAEDILRVSGALQYLIKAQLLEQEDPSAFALKAIVKAHEWDNPKTPKSKP